MDTPIFTHGLTFFSGFLCGILWPLLAVMLVDRDNDAK